jgi:hypothetical protein
MHCLPNLHVHLYARTGGPPTRAYLHMRACVPCARMLAPAVGGNREAANYLWELYYGGWAAPNIYFLGFAGCVRFHGLRIAGLSGINKQVRGVRVRAQQSTCLCL